MFEKPVFRKLPPLLPPVVADTSQDVAAAADLLLCVFSGLIFTGEISV